MKRLAYLSTALMLLSSVATPDARPPATAAHAMVATEQTYATQAGVSVLRSGGNAVDAAIAVAYALAVVDPCCGNIGGGGFMLVRMRGGRERFIDFREKAPLRARRDMFLDKNGSVVPKLSTDGFLAAGVPGTVMGMERARTLFGTMPRARLMAPAIALAQNGFVLGTGDARLLNETPLFGAQTHRAGERLVQTHLAATLRQIAACGAPAFYRGAIAREVVAASKAHGGILTMDDFAHYTVEESAPLHCSYRGYDIASAPPPSSGGTTMCEILNIAAPFPFAKWGWGSARSIHAISEAERRAYADRNTYLGDPDFIHNPVKRLLSPSYDAKLREEIEPDRATPSADVSPGLGPVQFHESEETTHFSVVDAAGNAVAMTFTINDTFGAKVIAGNTGFILNDEMDDFTSKPGVPNLYGLVQGVRNAIAPGKRPLSSMTPTIVTKNGNLFMVTGSPGGSRIITITLATLQNVIDYGMNVQQAVDAPRTNMQWLPDEIQYEPGALGNAPPQLKAMGYRLHEFDPWGSAQAIVVDPRTHVLYGGTDRRRLNGLAEGY